MSSLYPIEGIYYSIGSRDIPVGYNPNLKYGFDGSDPTPVFKYSLTNVNDFFTDPLICRRIRNTEVQTFITESLPDTGIKGLTPQEFEDNGFNALFEALNILYDRSDITDPDIVYDSKGDRLLSEASLQDRYQAGSLYMEFATMSTELRISYVKFKFKLFDNVEHTTISIYFIPDIMFERKGFDSGRYSISYTTKGLATESNLENIIASETNPQSILEFEKLKNYTNICEFTTQFNVVEDGVVVDTYDRTFFIYNVMYKGFELTTFKKILLIKRYLDNKYLIFGDSRRIILNKEYPELFTITTNDIIPVMTNRIQNRFSSLVTNDMIRRELERRGLTIDLEDEDAANRVEVIMLEGLSAEDNFDYNNTSKANRNFLTPILVVSNDILAIQGAITDMIYYAPTFTGYTPHGEKWEQFHFYLKLIIKLATGMLPWQYKDVSDEELMNKLKLPVSLQLSTQRVSISGSEFINTISFDFQEVTYTVHNFFKYGV